MPPPASPSGGTPPAIRESEQVNSDRTSQLSTERVHIDVDQDQVPVGAMTAYLNQTSHGRNPLFEPARLKPPTEVSGAYVLVEASKQFSLVPTQGAEDLASTGSIGDTHDLNLRDGRPCMGLGTNIQDLRPPDGDLGTETMPWDAGDQLESQNRIGQEVQNQPQHDTIHICSQVQNPLNQYPHRPSPTHTEYGRAMVHLAETLGGFVLAATGSTDPEGLEVVAPDRSFGRRPSRSQLILQGIGHLTALIVAAGALWGCFRQFSSS